MKHCLFPDCHAYYQQCQYALGMPVDLEWVIYEAELPLLTYTCMSQLYEGPRSGTLVKREGKGIKPLTVSNWNLNLGKESLSSC